MMKKDQKTEQVNRSEDLYGDIIHLPHFEPKNHERMSPYKRAAQFAPFAALTGYGDAITEASRYTEKNIDLSEDASDRLDRKLILLQEEIEKGMDPEISMVCFSPDEKKDGGAFVEVKGRLKRIDAYGKALVFHDGQRIPIRDIVDI